MPTTTPIQGLPIPVNADAPNIPDHFDDLASNIENKLVMRFASASARTTALPTPVEGMMTVLTGTKEYQIYASGAWRTFYCNDTGANATRYQPTATYLSAASGRPTAASQQHGAIGYNRQQGVFEVVMGDGAWHVGAARKIGQYAHTTHGTGARLFPNGTAGSATITWTQASAAYVHIHGLVQGYADSSRFGAGVPAFADVYINAIASGPGFSSIVITPTSRHFASVIYTQANMTIAYDAWFLGSAAGTYNCHIQTYNAAPSPATDFVLMEQFIAIEPIMISATEWA